MAQVYKMMLGTSGRQWKLLTVKDDGTMTMTFHGTDREISHEVTEDEDGWLCYPGAMYPGLESGKWVLTDCPAESAEIAESAQPTVKAATVAKPQPTEQPTVNHEPLIVNRPARPKRQRKARKAAPVRRDIESSRQRNIETQEPTTDNGWLRSAGYLAAASVALLVIWQTGLIIPLGLIGLATSGLLK
jgi:hypothetical protein